MTPIFFMPCRGGHLQETRSFKDHLQRFDGIVAVTVDKPKNKRSLKQNAYLFGVVYKLISEETGYNIDQVHELMKVEHGLTEFIEIGNITREIVRSTTTYTVEEFSEYWSRIQIWAASFLGISIPDPDQVEI